MSPDSPQRTEINPVEVEPPPILAGRDGGWKRIYVAVLVLTAALIVALYAVTLLARY